MKMLKNVFSWFGLYQFFQISIHNINLIIFPVD